MKAMLDRIEEEKAVLLIQDLKKEWVIDRSDLPQGIKAGDWLTVEITQGRISSIVIDPALTQGKKQTADKLLESIRGQNKVSKFKRK